jgi:hypothetical protein
MSKRSKRFNRLVAALVLLAVMLPAPTRDGNYGRMGMMMPEVKGITGRASPWLRCPSRV